MRHDSRAIHLARRPTAHDKSAPEGKIPVVYTKEHIKHEAARKMRAEEQKHREKAVEAALRTPAPYPIDALGSGKQRARGFVSCGASQSGRSITHRSSQADEPVPKDGCGIGRRRIFRRWGGYEAGEGEPNI
jgi:hypothetical protein